MLSFLLLLSSKNISPTYAADTVSLRHQKVEPEFGVDLPQARESSHAPSDFSQVYTFGFDSDYYCSGRITDEPRKMRLSCTKNPQRKMNCQCADQSGNSLTTNCRCTPAFTSTKKVINLEDKFVSPP
jgi:hypothetical protein